MAENHVVTIDEAIRTFFPLYIHHIESMEKIKDLYTIKKRENNCVDFDDLLCLTLKLLKNNKSVYEKVAAMFQHVMVDEFQDTNKVQAEIALLLAKPHGNIMVVGDDMQSIYSFRGAHYRNIIDFPNVVPNTKVYTLNSNYRSTPEILAFANALIESMDSAFPKDLVSHMTRGELPEVIHLPDDAQQAVYVANEIMNDIDNGVVPEEISVMYRAHSHCLRLQTELMRRDIPFTLRSGLKFFELAHIKDLLSFMKGVINPKDILSVGRLLKLIPGIGKKTVEKLMKVFSDENYEALLKKVRLKKEAKELVISIFQVLKSSTPEDDPVVCQREFLNNFYNERLPFIYDNPEERIQDIEAFLDISSGFDSLVNLLDDLSLMGENYKVKDGEREEENGIILTSVHQSKGLEWDVVYIIHCQDGAFPNNRCTDDRDKLQEEYRLFYVAVTRAKKSLKITYPALITGYKTFYSRISRFIGDIPDEFYERKSMRLDNDDTGFF
jgi:DNA helicase-2/ATP-dependent DNA helicase PcrA